jgi:hypothetical protein
MTPISLTACFCLMLSLALRTNPIEDSDATRRLNRENNLIGCELFLDKVEMKANCIFTCKLESYVHMRVISRYGRVQGTMSLQDENSVFTSYVHDKLSLG